jgi:hypothetical protein
MYLIRNKVSNYKILLVSLLLFADSSLLTAQDSGIRWQRRSDTARFIQLFHSTKAFHLPTGETLQKGDMQFELEHRFTTPVTSGWEGAYGLDGSVIMRIGLDYALTDRVLISMARSNLEGNIELLTKYKFLETEGTRLPLVMAIQAGLAYNGKPNSTVENSAGKVQYHASAIINTLYAKKIGLGLVPSYLYNSHIYCQDVQYSFTFGGYLQYYVSEFWSVLVEVNPTVTGWRDQYNSFAFGMEVETGGHFFKFLIGNNTRVNHSQFLAGAPDSFDSKDWHIGFNLTRLFKI